MPAVCSYTCAICSRSASPNVLPMICSPIGSRLLPVLSNPQGIDTAGKPALQQHINTFDGSAWQGEGRESGFADCCRLDMYASRQPIRRLMALCRKWGNTR